MRCKQILSRVFVTALGWCAVAAPLAAEQTSQFLIEMRLYRIMTNITDSGLISQILPGAAGSFQIVHEKLDDVELTMEGETLTWNGQPEPDNPRIERVAGPSALTLEGEEAKIAIGQEARLQYFERGEDGRFDLRTLNGETPLGIMISVTPRRSAENPDVVNVDLSFKSTWVQEREKVEGVDLDVGKPILRTQSVQDVIGARLNEWVCYQTHVPSRGYLYVFMRVTKK